MNSALLLLTLLSANAPAPLAVDDACVDVARKDGGAAAAACYRALERSRADTLTDAERRTLDALIDAALSLELVPPDARRDLAASFAPPPAVSAPVQERFDPFDFSTLIASGKGELVATSTLGGAVAAVLAYTGLLSLAQVGIDTPLLAFGLMTPVAGGALGFGASLAGSAFVPALSPGKAHLIRAFELLGGFNALMVPLVVGTTENGPPELLWRAMPLLSMTLIASSTAAGVGLAFLPLPEEAGPMAISGGAWATVLAMLVYAAVEPLNDRRGEWLTRVALASGNGGFLLAGALSYVAPVSRLETWAIDAGGVLGGLGAFALANQLHAPNPQVGWGGTALGVVGGMATGLVLARTLPSLSDALPLPELVAFAPGLVPDSRGRVDVVGTLRVRLP